MNKESFIAEVTKAGFFETEGPEFRDMQPFTSAFGRVIIAVKKIGPREYSGVAFWVHEAEHQWFLALFRGCTETKLNPYKELRIGYPF
jgi:hypothetical protein